MVEAKKQTDTLDASLEQLGNSLENLNIEFERCWTLLIQGVDFIPFWNIISTDLLARLLPWGPPDQFVSVVDAHLGLL